VIRTDDAIGHAAATADVDDRRSTCAQHAIEAIEKGLDATKEDYQIE
jgi:hypothetical protein